MLGIYDVGIVEGFHKIRKRDGRWRVVDIIKILVYIIRAVNPWIQLERDSYINIWLSLLIYIDIWLLYDLYKHYN